MGHLESEIPTLLAIFLSHSRAENFENQIPSNGDIPEQTDRRITENRYGRCIFICHFIGRYLQ